MLRIFSFFMMCCLTTIAISSTDIFVPIYFTTTKNAGELAGTIHITQTDYGLLFTPALHGLPPGEHDLNVHENPSCAHQGLAAGDDLDPYHTHQHLGPYNSNGHLGDLPMLYVSKEGVATLPVLAPRILNIMDVKNHSLVIQASNKNDKSSHNNRIACGVIENNLFSD